MNPAWQALVNTGTIFVGSVAAGFLTSRYYEYKLTMIADRVVERLMNAEKRLSAFEMALDKARDDERRKWIGLYLEEKAE